MTKRKKTIEEEVHSQHVGCHLGGDWSERNKKLDALIDLLRKCPTSLIDKVTYLAAFEAKKWVESTKEKVDDFMVKNLLLDEPK